MWIAFVAAAVYLALKSGQFAFLGKAAGYRVEPVSLAQRLGKGEPALLIVATLISVPPAFAGTWYHKHKFEQVLSHSVGCYALIRAYQEAPEIKHSNEEHAVYRSIYGYRGDALDASRQLGVDAGVTQRQLDQTASTLVAESRRADDGIGGGRLVETQSCLHPLKAPPNA